MAVEEAMTINERRTYLKRMLPRYRVANRAERGRLLTEMETMTGMHRKSLIRLLAAPSLARPPRRTPRTRRYGPEIAAIIGRCLGELGLCLCRTADARPRGDGSAPCHLRRTDAHAAAVRPLG